MPQGHESETEDRLTFTATFVGFDTSHITQYETGITIYQIKNGEVIWDSDIAADDIKWDVKLK